MARVLDRSGLEKLEDLKSRLWNFTFNLLDAEFGGVLAGTVAQFAVEGLDERIRPELEIDRD